MWYSGDSEALAAWYRDHLGLPLVDFGGAILKWSGETVEDQRLTVWHVASKDSEWFSPSLSPFMINYRVDDLDQLLEQLRAADVTVVQGPEHHENGKFVWIMDPDGNKIELWEPMLWDKKNKESSGLHRTRTVRRGVFRSIDHPGNPARGPNWRREEIR